MNTLPVEIIMPNKICSIIETAEGLCFIYNLNLGSGFRKDWIYLNVWGYRRHTITPAFVLPFKYVNGFLVLRSNRREYELILPNYIV